MPSERSTCIQPVRSPSGRKRKCRNPATANNFCSKHAQMYRTIRKGLRVIIGTANQPAVRDSVGDLAEAALNSLERIDTAQLAALGRDSDAELIENARRFLDRLKVETAQLRVDGGKENEL